MHRPLRIQFVVTSLPVGGAEVLLLNLVSSMDNSNFQPEVVCLKEPGAMSEEFAKRVPLHSRLIVHKWDIGVLWRLRKLFRQQKADAVITVGAGDKMFWGRLAAKLAGVPVICSALHSTGWPDGVGRLNRLLTGLTSGFIAVAAQHAQHLVGYEGFPANRVFTIPNGVDTNRFVPQLGADCQLRKELKIPKGTPLVGIVAALRPEKNHQQFVEAAKRVLLQHPTAHFIIVGDGPQRESIQAAIASTGFSQHFHMLGNRSDTPRILASLDIFCLTSRNEANPVSILEALSCGVPVVSPNVGSISETVLPDRTGILTKPLCPEETAQAISKLLSDSTLARRLGQNGRLLVQSSWSLQSMVEGYQSLIESLYNQHLCRRGQSTWVRQSESASNSVGSIPESHFGLDLDSTLPIIPSVTLLSNAPMSPVSGARIS